MGKINQLQDKLSQLEARRRQLEAAAQQARQALRQQQRQDQKRRQQLIGEALIARLDWPLLRDLAACMITRKKDRDFLQCEAGLDLQPGELQLALLFGLATLQKHGAASLLQPVRDQDWPDGYLTLINKHELLAKALEEPKAGDS